MDHHTFKRGKFVYDTVRSAKGKIYFEPTRLNPVEGAGIGAALATGLTLLSGPVGWAGLATVGLTGGIAGYGATLFLNSLPQFSTEELEKRMVQTRVKDIPRYGGELEDGGCILTIEADTFINGSEVDQLTIFADGMSPNDHVPVTRMVDVNSELPKKPIKLQLESLYTPAGYDGVKVVVFEIPRNKTHWHVIERVYMNGPVVRLEQKNIDRLVVAIKESELHLLKFRMKALLYSNSINNLKFWFIRDHSVMAGKSKSQISGGGFKEVFKFDFEARGNDKIIATLDSKPYNKFYIMPESTSPFTIGESMQNSYNKKTFDLAMGSKNPPVPPEYSLSATITVAGREQQTGCNNGTWHRADEIKAQSSGAGAGMNPSQIFNIHTIQAQGSPNLGAVGGIHNYNQHGGGN